MSHTSPNLLTCQELLEGRYRLSSRSGGRLGREPVFPNGRFQLVLSFGPGTASVSGLRSKFVVVDTAAVSCAMGVVFAAAPTYFFAASARKLSERCRYRWSGGRRRLDLL